MLTTYKNGITLTYMYFHDDNADRLDVEPDVIVDFPTATPNLDFLWFYTPRTSFLGQRLAEFGPCFHSGYDAEGRFLSQDPEGFLAIDNNVYRDIHDAPLPPEDDQR